MFTLILTVLHRDYSSPYDNPQPGLLVQGGSIPSYKGLVAIVVSNGCDLLGHQPCKMAKLESLTSTPLNPRSQIPKPYALSCLSTPCEPQTLNPSPLNLNPKAQNPTTKPQAPNLTSQHRLGPERSCLRRLPAGRGWPLPCRRLPGWEQGGAGK